jgi:hypothetical protein
MQTKEIGIILLIMLLGITLFSSYIPYTTSQFVNQSTDLNYSSLLEGDNDGKGLLWDSDINKWSITTLQNDVDGGSANSVYLNSQRTDGGKADNS